MVNYFFLPLRIRVEKKFFYKGGYWSAGIFRLICNDILVGLINICREITRKYFIRLSSEEGPL